MMVFELLLKDRPILFSKNMTPECKKIREVAYKQVAAATGQDVKKVAKKVKNAKSKTKTAYQATGNRKPQPWMTVR